MKNLRKILIVIIVAILRTALVLTLNKREENKNKISCTILISAEALKADLSKLPESKRSLVPENGMLLEKKEVKVSEGENAFDLLLSEAKAKKLHLDFLKNPGGSSYIKGIGNIYEGDAGELSGWMYKVNRELPSVGAGDYIIKNGDEIEWIYSVDLLKDMM